MNAFNYHKITVSELTFLLINRSFHTQIIYNLKYKHYCDDHFFISLRKFLINLKRKLILKHR